MIEETKTWVLLFLFSIIVTFSYYLHHQSTLDDANQALEQAKSMLKSMQEQLSLKNKSWHEKERVAIKLQSENDRHTTLLGTQDTLDQRYHKADSDFKYALESMKESMNRTRNNAPGTELGEIKLANGKTLRDVKIRKVEDSGISFLHADGVGTIPSDQVPENLKEQYDLGPNALVPMIQNAQKTLLQKSEPDKKDKLVTTAPAMPISPPSVSPIATNTVDDSKIKNIRMRMAELDSRITAFHSVVAQHLSAAKSHQNLAESAKERGVPSTRHTENANKSLAQAALLENQKAGLIEERGKLAVELEYAMRGK